MNDSPNQDDQKPFNHWKRATTRGLLLQFVLLVVCSLVLDGGRTLQIYLAGMLGQLIMTAWVLSRRRRSPNAADLLFIRYGIFLSFSVSAIMTTILGRLR